MKENVLQQFIGLKVQKVRYFELNDPNQPFYFKGFDNFDLGIEIECSNWSYWHIGWKNNDRPEIGLGKYDYALFYEDAVQIDATNRWSDHINSPIIDIELIYVSQEWKIPAKCTLTFENGKFVTIVIGAELNLDGSLPVPLSYGDGSEFYVFIDEDNLPEIELVRIVQPKQYFEKKKEGDILESEQRIEVFSSDKSAWNTIVIILTLMGILYLIFIYFSTD